MEYVDCRKQSRDHEKCSVYCVVLDIESFRLKDCSRGNTILSFEKTRIRESAVKMKDLSLNSITSKLLKHMLID